MKLQQLRYIWEVAQHQLNVSVTAHSLHTSQPGISKQIRLLEDELGVEVFSRSGKHLTRVTPAGEKILEMAGEILRQTESIKKLALEYSDANRGNLSIAVTHTQAQFSLPTVLTSFLTNYSEVTLSVHQDTPFQVAEMISEGTVDFAIAAEALNLFSNLILLPCFRWNRSIIVPKDHPLAAVSKPTLAQLAEFPLITYAYGYADHSKVDDSFLKQNLLPKVIFAGQNSELIMTYVKLGFGIGIVTNMARSTLPSELVAIDASHLFDYSVTTLALRKGIFLRAFMYDFIQQYAPHLTRDRVEEAVSIGSRAEVETFFNETPLPTFGEESDT